MPTVFISSTEDDAPIARQIADAIQAHGSVVSRPMAGASDNGTQAAIERSDVVVLVISPSSLGSVQMTDEIAAGTRRGKSFLPVLISLTHAEFAHRAPEWQAAIGAATSVAVPASGVEAVLPRILEGVAALTAPQGPSASGIRTFGPRSLAGIALVVVLVGAGAALLVSGGTDDETSDASARTDLVTTTFAPGPLADAATTPLTTSIGNLQITEAHLTSKVCGTNTDECATASGSDRFVLVTLAEVTGKDVTVTEDFRRDLSDSYVEFEGHRATYTDATQDFFLSVPRSSLRIAYKFVPASATGGDVRLAWPESPTLQLHV